MNTTHIPIQDAIKACGGITSLARAIGITPAAVSQWATGDRPVPAPRCPAIEIASKFSVRRWSLRPDDWDLIWPELIGTEGAPTPPNAPTGASHE